MLERSGIEKLLLTITARERLLAVIVVGGVAGLIAGWFVAALTVILSWAVVHSVFALRYAHEYYTEPIGGIDFKNPDPPDYRDFIYVAFTVGMTFQVSDTDVQSRTVRRTVINHALLAYLFGAVILALTVNIAATLLQS